MPAIKLSERERNLAVITLGFVIFYVVYQFLLTPLWSETDKIKEKVRKQRVELKITGGKLKILEGLEKSAGLIPLSPETPRTEKALEVFRELSSLTTKSGINLNYLKPLLETKGEDLKFNLSCSGKFNNLYRFLLLLRETRMAIMVEDLYVRSEGGESPKLIIEMTLSARF